MRLPHLRPEFDVRAGASASIQGRVIEFNVLGDLTHTCKHPSILQQYVAPVFSIRLQSVACESRSRPQVRENARGDSLDEHQRGEQDQTRAVMLHGLVCKKAK
jgi:hypothetical protein